MKRLWRKLRTKWWQKRVYKITFRNEVFQYCQFHSLYTDNKVEADMIVQFLQLKMIPAHLYTRDQKGKGDWTP